MILRERALGRDTYWSDDPSYGLTMVAAQGLSQPNNGAPIFSGNQLHIVQSIAVVAAALSLVSGLIVGWWFIRMKRSFRHHLIMLLIFSDFFKASWQLTYPAVVISQGAVTSRSRFCQLSGFFMSVGIEASDFAVLVIAIHSALYIFRPGMTAIGEGGLYHYRYYVYTAWFIFSLLMPSLAFLNTAPAYTAQSSYCYLPIRPFWYRIFLTWFPRYIILVTILVLYAAIYIYVRKKFQNFRTNVGSSTLEMDTVDLEADDKPKPSEGLPSLEAHGLIPPSPALERDSRHSSVSSNYPLPKSHLPSPFAPIDKIEMHSFTDSSTSGGPSRRGSDFARGYGHLLPERNPNMTQFTASSEMRRRRVAIDRQLRLLFIYPIFYTLMWVPPLISHCMQYTEHFVEHPSFPLACVVAFTVPFQCFVDCWVFTIREKPWRYIPQYPGGSVISRYGFSIRKCKGKSLEPGAETCHEGAWKNQKHMSYEARKAYERRDAERREAAETWLDQGHNRIARRSGVSWWDVGGDIEEETEEDDEEDEKEAGFGYEPNWRSSFSFDVFSRLEEGHGEQSDHHSPPQSPKRSPSYASHPPS